MSGSTQAVANTSKDLNMVEKVPFFNYPVLYTKEREKYLEIMDDVLSRGAFIMQKDLEEFESSLVDFTGIKHALGVADCTNGLAIGLRACGIGPGDEVIVPSHTFIASPGSVKLVGATPVLADIGDDCMLDAASVETRITSKTKAIMPVQVNGRCCDMDAMRDVADRHGLMIVEDAAQALGAKYKGTCAGGFGKFGAISFYPAKTLGCFGDGGACVTNDDEIERKMAIQRDHGRYDSDELEDWGTNCRLDNMQAALLNYKMGQYEQEINRRREIARRYQDAFEEISDLTLPIGPNDDPDRFDIFQNYELQADRRDELREYLSEHNIGTLIQWSGRAVHQWKNLGLGTNDLPRTEEFFKKCFLLPMNTLLTDAEVDKVIHTVRTFYGV